MIEQIKEKRKAFAAKHAFGISSLFLVLVIASVLLVSGRSKSARADEAPVLNINAPSFTTTSDEQPRPLPAGVAAPETIVPAKAQDTLELAKHSIIEDIPTNYRQNVAVVGEGISKNAEVVLTEHQAIAVKAFSDYLLSKGEGAIVTSGKRTSESQLNIVKQRIAEHGVMSKFPLLAKATVANTKSWLKAWQWLRAKRVPVNAPADVAGAEGRSSMHLKGLAVDFISNNLDRLRGLLADFSHSSYAKAAGVQIEAIVREPGCVHINIA